MPTVIFPGINILLDPAVQGNKPDWCPSLGHISVPYNDNRNMVIIFCLVGPLDTTSLTGVEFGFGGL